MSSSIIMFGDRPNFLTFVQAIRKPFIDPAASAATSWNVLVRTSQLESSQAMFPTVDTRMGQRQVSNAKQTERRWDVNDFEE